MGLDRLFHLEFGHELDISLFVGLIDDGLFAPWKQLDLFHLAKDVCFGAEGEIEAQLDDIVCEDPIEIPFCDEDQFVSNDQT